MSKESINKKDLEKKTVIELLNLLDEWQLKNSTQASYIDQLEKRIKVLEGQLNFMNSKKYQIMPPGHKEHGADKGY
jgi:hypothetical protein